MWIITSRVKNVAACESVARERIPTYLDTLVDTDPVACDHKDR